MSNLYFLIHSLKGRSGTERVTCQLANIFDNFGYKVIILNLDTPKNSVAFDINDTVDIVHFSGSIFNLLRKLKSLNEKDILFIQNMERLALLTLFLKPQSKNICLEHGVFFVKSKFGKLLTQYLYPRLDALVTITYADAENYLRFLDRNKVHTIYNSTPFSPENITYNFASKKIIAVGRLSTEKNFSALIHAWSFIYHEYPDWCLEIYGDGPEEHTLKNLIKELTLQNVTIKENSNNIAEVYKNASFLVQTSKFEGLGMVLIEAQSFGLPIIAYDCPYGPAEIISHSHNGFLVEPNNINLLVKNIKKLMSSQELCEEMSVAAIKSVSKFDTYHVNDKWLRLFNKF